MTEIVNKLKPAPTENPHFVGLYENVLSKEECSGIIEIFEKYKSFGLASSRIQSENAPPLEKKDDTVDAETVVKFDTNTIYAADPLKKLINKVSLIVENEYANEFGSISVHNKFMLRHFRIQKTAPSGGYHVWHSEKTTSFYQDRVLTWTFYLNDIEEGGETELLNYGIRIKPKAGTLCMFPAGWTHTHRGNPPYKKEKYIVTGWIVHD